MLNQLVCLEVTCLHLCNNNHFIWKTPGPTAYPFNIQLVEQCFCHIRDVLLSDAGNIMVVVEDIPVRQRQTSSIFVVCILLGFFVLERPFATNLSGALPSLATFELLDLGLGERMMSA